MFRQFKFERGWAWHRVQINQQKYGNIQNINLDKSCKNVCSYMLWEHFMVFK